LALALAPVLEKDMLVGANAYLTQVKEVHEVHLRVLREIREPTIGARLHARNERQPAQRRFVLGELVATARRRTSAELSAKLLLQWDGPFKIVGIISSNIFELKHQEVAGLETTASAANMVHWSPSVASSRKYFAALEARIPVPLRDDPKAPQHFLLLPSDFVVGSVVAVWDIDLHGKSYWLGKILSVDMSASEFTIHYFGVTNKQNPIFKLVWCHGAGRMSWTLSKAAWTGVESIFNVFMTNVRLSNAGALLTPIEGRPTTMREAALAVS
jgi:hypothetical protein